MPKAKAQRSGKDGDSANTRRTHSLLKGVLTRDEREFCKLIAKGVKVGDAARAVGVDERTGYRWMKAPRVAKYLSELTARVEEEMIQSTAKSIVLSLDIADKRLLEMLTAPRQDVIGAMIIGARAKVQAQAESRAAKNGTPAPPPISLVPEGMSMPESAPIDDHALAKAIDLAYKRKRGYEEKPPSGTAQQIVADTVVINNDRTYEPEWIRKQHGITDPIADAVDSRLQLPAAKAGADAPLASANPGTKSRA